MNKSQFFKWCTVLSVVLLITINISSNAISNTEANSEAQENDGENEVWMEYFYQAGCGICISAEIVIDAFLTNHPEINYSKTEVRYGYNSTEFYAYLDSLGLERAGTPSVVFHKDAYAIILDRYEITNETLEERFTYMQNYNGTTQIDEGLGKITPWLSFFSGFLSGISPCLVLIMAVISPTLSMENLSKKQLSKIFLGLTLGIISMYIILGLAFIGSVEFLQKIFYLDSIKWVLGGLMIGLGIWYILDAFTEKSALFSTPEGIKSKLSDMIRKGNFGYGFLLGFLFTLIKIPCVAGIMVALFLGIAENPVYFTLNLALFYLGLLLPLLLLMFLLLKGTNSEKVKAFRLKFRPYLRILSGLVIIGLTLYSILFA